MIPKHTTALAIAAGALFVLLLGSCASHAQPATGQIPGPATVTVKSVTLKEPPEALTPEGVRTQSFFAMNGTKMFHVPDKMEGLVQQRFDWLDELGVSWDRIDLWWHEVEPQPGMWNFDWPDKAFDEYERHGVQWYPILCYGAKWWPKDHNGPSTQEQYEQFADYAYRTVSRYKGRAPYWSMWNEPNIPTFWQPVPKPEDYVALTKLTYQAVKRADPDAKLCAPVIAPIGGWDRKFVERCYQLGIKDSFDVFDYHYYKSYPPEREVPAEFAEIQAVMARYGDRKPMWISESGVSTIAVGEDRQAAYVARNQLLALALGVERFFYFDLQNWEDNNKSQWDSQLGLVKTNGKKKPSFSSYQTVVRETDHRDVVGRVRGLGENVEGVLLRDPATMEYILAIWGIEDGKAQRVEVQCRPEGCRVVSTPSGNVEEILPSLDGKVRSLAIDVTMHPKFVHGVDPMTYLPMAAVELAPAHTILAVGENAPLAVEVHPFLENPKVTVKSVGGSVILNWNPASQRLSEMSGLAMTTEIPTGKKTIEAVLQVEYGPANDRRSVELKRSAVVEVTPPLSITFRPYWEDGKLAAEVALVNQGRTPISGTIRLAQIANGAEQTLLTKETEPLAPGAARTVDLPVTQEMVNAIKDSAKWRVSFGPGVSRDFNILVVRFSESAPKPDGKIDEWKNLPAMINDRADQLLRNVGPWSPQNASAETRIWLTPEKLYFATNVTDNDPMVNANKPVEMYKGDAMELFVGFGGPSRRKVIDKAVDFQIGIAPTTSDGKPAAFWFHIDKRITGAKVVQARTEHGYVMEASIPLASLELKDLNLHDGMLLGLDCTLDDIDTGDTAPADNQPGRAIVWNGTPMNWIDPSGWGMAVLRKE